MAAQAMLYKPRTWQACTSRHNFDVNCLSDLKNLNQKKPLNCASTDVSSLFTSTSKRAT
jgi:hypothetical protein